ncbi:uncharacterized protein B0I36DRAFT_338685 [Microdochium trichocladiopsis]|uniref:Uncharacterized protein n=1 Tax=Microdochium trichocladiopsis TaxID=1682393 RepID=A0A9P8XVB2_9PEZI|nr:uncharacterized protein B0I36DRAFT_338685 [Microdochium trichocladiopsis]KAH7014413.1 hypothetical protein B0I36DRAFT_338685 [Microdochium trichocladiopsis]
MSTPTGLSDGAISVEFPAEAADECITHDGILPGEAPWDKRFALHMFRYRQIQSELRTMLWERFPSCVQVDLRAWQEQMRDRIDTWYQSTPLGNDLDAAEQKILETLEVTHRTAIFHLYRPSPNIPSPDGQQGVAMAQAAIKVVELYERYFRRHMLSIYWRSIENIFLAGTGLLLAYAQFPAVREVIDFASLEAHVHTCASLLWGMVERFPSFQGKRDAFDETAKKVLEELRKARTEVETGDFGAGRSTDLDIGPSTFQAGLDDHGGINHGHMDQSDHHHLTAPWLQGVGLDDHLTPFYPSQGDLFSFQDFDIMDFMDNSFVTDSNPDAHFSTR